MIIGTVTRYRAYVSLKVRGPQGQEGEVEFLLDTGFSGQMALPPAACTALGFPFARPQPTGLADGSRTILDVHLGAVIWDGQECDVEVLAKEGTPLVGMRVLGGSEVRLEVKEGGRVTIVSLPPSA